MATLTMLRNAHLPDTPSSSENEQQQQEQLLKRQKANGSVKHRLDDESGDENTRPTDLGAGSDVNSKSNNINPTTINGEISNQTTNRRKLKPNSLSSSPSTSLLRSNSSSSIESNSSTATSSSSSSSTSSSSRKGLPGRSQYAMVLVLVPLNGTFERKSLVVPFAPDVLKLGRQTNAKTAPNPDNGYFDSRVLSRQHAEIWADKLTGKVWIKDAKSSNGTYINKQRLSSDNTESEPCELKKNDILELGIDICGDDGLTLVHRKISAKVERVSVMSLQPNNIVGGSSNELLSSSSSSSSIHTLKNSSGNGVVNTTNSAPINSVKHLNGKILVMNGANNPPKSITNGTTIRRSEVNGSKMRRMGMTGGQGSDGSKSTDPLDVTLFGDMDDSLEDLVLGHTRNSVGGLFMHNGLNSSLAFESTVKRLIGEIHSVKLEGAKLKSVAKVLQDIKLKQDKTTQLASSVPEELIAKNAYITELESRLQDQTILDKLLAEEQSRRKILEQENQLLQEKLVGDSLTKTETTAPSTTSTIEILTAELSSTHEQLELFKLRAQKAEELASKQTSTIEILQKSLEELHRQKEIQDQLLLQERMKNQPPPSSNSAYQQLHQTPFDTLPPSLQIAVSAGHISPSTAATTTTSNPTSDGSPTDGLTPTNSSNSGTGRILSTQTTSRAKPTTSNTNKTIPMTTALGVVVLGISLMSVLNRLSRDR